MAEEQGNRKMWYALLVASVGSGFQHGYNTGILNHPADLIQDWINDTLADKGMNMTPKLNSQFFALVASMYTFGGIIGGLLTSVFLNKFGPKQSLFYNCFIVIVGAAIQLLCAFSFANHVAVVIVGRVIIGVNSGLNAGICPVFCCDIAPLKIRGTAGSLYQLFITISVLAAFIVGMKELLGTEKLWVYAMSVPPLAVAIIQAILLLGVPESPLFFLNAKENEEATAENLKKFRKNEDIKPELDKMIAERDKMKAMPKLHLKDFCKDPNLKQPLIIIICMMLAQQLSGINAVVFYSGLIYKNQANLSVLITEVANIVFGVINVIMTIVSVFFVDKVGRKLLLLIAYGGLIICTSGLMVSLLLVDKISAMAYVAIGFVFLYIILFASGAGSIPWFLAAEMFEPNAKPVAQSIAVAVNWGANFLVVWCFPILEGYVGSWVFLMYIICLVLTVIYILFRVPETKGRTVPEVQQLIKDKNYSFKQGIATT